MTDNKTYDVIILGGSYSGLSAAMALGRSLRSVLIIDSGMPCNKQTPHSHNFITHDGKTPEEISTLARQQVEQYDTVAFYSGLAIKGIKTNQVFAVTTQSGDTFSARKLVVATGIRDEMPDIPGFSECWGISGIHCPYCHGYEVRHQPTGILANGDSAYEMAKLISNWTEDITLFTNGTSTLSIDQTQRIEKHRIRIIEKQIRHLQHRDGQLEQLMFDDGDTFPIQTVYARVGFTQHCEIPLQLGCTLTEHGHIQVDALQRTSIPGIFSCGDSASMMRSVANAVASGNFVGAVANKELIEEDF